MNLKLQQFQLAALLLLFSISQVTLSANQYDGFKDFTVEELQMVDAKYYSHLFNNEADYETYVTKLKELYIEKQKTNKLIKGYYFYFFNDLTKNVFINPCLYGYKWCLTLKQLPGNEGVDRLQDKPVIDKAGEIIVAWKLDRYLYECSEEFMLKKKCGTFLEIHRPFSSTVLGSYQITSLEAGKLELLNLSIHSFCAGKYEIWFISLTRIGKFIHYIKPIFVDSPSCDCSTVVSDLGFSCDTC